MKSKKNDIRDHSNKHMDKKTDTQAREKMNKLINEQMNRRYFSKIT